MRHQWKTSSTAQIELRTTTPLFERESGSTSPGYEVEPLLRRRQQKHEREQNSKAKHQYSDSHTMQLMHPNASIPLSENTALPGHPDTESSGSPISFRVQALLWPPARFILGGRYVNSAALVNNQPVYVLFQSVFNWEASKRSGSVFMFFFLRQARDKWTNPVVHQGNFFFCSLWTVASNVIRVKALFVLSCPLLWLPIAGHVYKGKRPLNKCSFHLVRPWKKSTHRKLASCEVDALCVPRNHNRKPSDIQSQSHELN